MSEPKALLNVLPHAWTAVSKPSSLHLYHFEEGSKAPCHPVRTRTKNSPLATHREKHALANTQEEARQKSPDKVVGNSGQDRDEIPKGHANGEVYGGFPHTIDERIPVPHGAEVSRRSDLDQKQKAYEGTCMVIYPTQRTLRIVANWFPVRPRSSLKPRKRAALHRRFIPNGSDFLGVLHSCRVVSIDLYGVSI
jgi:hypothetical protein